MRILEQGRLPESEPKRCRCPKCSTLFEFLPSEAQESPDQRDPGRYILCPLCKHYCWEALWTSP